MRALIVLLAFASLTLSCASPASQARSAEPSGFLGDYSKLKEGGKDEALLVYRNPSASFASYDKILFEPVTVWASKKVEIPDDELQGVVDYLDSAVRNALGGDYQLVDRAGPGTLRLRIAITEAIDANAVMGTVSTIVPQARLLSEAKRVATGTAGFVGTAGVEGELSDSLTGERLFAAVDRRAGGKSVSGATQSWKDVKDAFDHWAGRLKARLAAERAKG
jgi:hypothetical protein